MPCSLYLCSLCCLLSSCEDNYAARKLIGTFLPGEIHFMFGCGHMRPKGCPGCDSPIHSRHQRGKVHRRSSSPSHLPSHPQRRSSSPSHLSSHPQSTLHHNHINLHSSIYIYINHNDTQDVVLFLSSVDRH